MNNASVSSENDLYLRSKEFSLHVIIFLKTLPNNHIYWSITDQLMRSATSIGANLHESKASESRKEFTHYQQISLKSAVETQYWLELLLESELCNKEETQPLLQETEQLIRMLTSSVKKLKFKS